MIEPQRQADEGPQSLDYATPQSRRWTPFRVACVIIGTALLVAGLLVLLLLVMLTPRPIVR